MQMEYYLRLK